MSTRITQDAKEETQLVTEELKRLCDSLKCWMHACLWHFWQCWCNDCFL